MDPDWEEAVQLPGYSVEEPVYQTERVRVVRARRDEDGRRVVVKLLKDERPTSHELARIRHEYSLLKLISQPSVVQPLELIEKGHTIALVLEDAGRKTLNDLIKDQALSVAGALSWSIALAHAVDQLHQRGIVHKDIKPKNIAVDVQNKSVKLLDFGLATRLAHETAQASPIHDLEGTLTHTSPEQTGRVNRSVDARSDLYSLGVTLYELFTGQLPFESEDPLVLVHSHIAVAPTGLHKIRSEIPEAVSDIVLTLLSKEPEDRYQSAYGLQRDLELCLEQWKESNRVRPFALKEHDRIEALHIPQKLYGREAELAALRRSFDRISHGAVELLLITGSAGIGKSALVDEVNRGIAEHRGGYYVVGKFDQRNRSTPFVAIAAAFRDLMKQMLAESEARLAECKRNLSAALGSNGAVLIDLIPELEWIVGPQPAVAELGPAESQNRLALTFQNFIRAVADVDHPLVVFLDDLQWAEPASLKLLELLLTSSQSQYVLVVGAYRGEEVGASHPLSRALESIRAAERSFDAIRLSALPYDDVHRWVADTVQRVPESVEALSKLVYERTHGNPFYVQQYLEFLHREGLLVYDTEKRRWTWDIESIGRTSVMDNVVDLMTEKIQRAAPKTQRALRYASCVGHRFDLRTLASVCDTSPEELAESLWEALEERLLLPLDAGYRLAAHQGEEGTASALYRFSHDRIQQAAYTLIPVEERAGIHLRIGRYLKADYEARAAEAPELLFDLVEHLNLGASEISEPSERAALARWNLQAAKRAQSSTAYDAAAVYLDAGLAMLDSESWAEHYDLAYPMHVRRAECAYLTGDFERAEHLFEKSLKHAASTLDQARVHNLRMVLDTMLGKFPDVVAVGRVALALFDVEIPERLEALEPQIGHELGKVQKHLEQQAISALVEAPPLSDATDLMIAELLANMTQSAYFVSPPTLAVVVAKQVNLSLEKGQSMYSAWGYAWYGIMMALQGHYGRAREFCELGVSVSERQANRDLNCRINFILGSTLAHFVAPLPEAMECLQRSINYGYETCDFTFLTYAHIFTVTTRFNQGQPLMSIEEDVHRLQDLGRKTKEQFAEIQSPMLEHVVRNLLGETHGPDTLTSGDFSEEGYLTKVRSGPEYTVHYGLYNSLRAQLHVHYGEFDKAKTVLEAMTAVLQAAQGAQYVTEFPFFRAITLSSLCEGQEEEEQERFKALIQTDLSELQMWAEACPENQRHKQLLVEAEVARLESDEVACLRLYDEAIAAARDQGFWQHEALANEFCARYHLSRGRHAVARGYLEEAAYSYDRWGAKAKVTHLLAAYPTLLKLRGEAGGSTHASVTRNSRGKQSAARRLDLDALTAIRAAHAMSSELELDKLIAQVLEALAQNAGAQHAALFLSQDNLVRLEAMVEVDGEDSVKTGLDQAVGEAEGVARSVVHYVTRTQEQLVLSDPTGDRRFSHDPHVQRRQPKSLLCAPMTYRGQMIGILYMENHVTRDAFSEERLEILQLLSAQAAVAIENARLYASVKASNAMLEERVAERTERLEVTLKELWSEMDLARKIQTVLLPDPREICGYDVHARMLPALNVGGDYYDFIQTGDIGWVLVGDVSGHGVSAGLIMMMAQTAIRTATSSFAARGIELSPSMLLGAVNEAIWENLQKIGEGQYMTASALRLDGDRIHHSGLHQDLLVYRAASGSIDRIPSRGLWLGIEQDVSEVMTDDSFDMAPGDIVLLYSDGVTESRVTESRVTETQDTESRVGNASSHKVLGVHGLTELFLRRAGETTNLEQIVQGLLKDIEPYENDDDTTLVVLRRQ